MYPHKKFYSTHGQHVGSGFPRDRQASKSAIHHRRMASQMTTELLPAVKMSGCVLSFRAAAAASVLLFIV